MLAAITEVFTSMSSTIVSLFDGVTGLFWDSTNNSLTFIGVIACIMGAISVMLLVFNLIRSFFSFHG